MLGVTLTESSKVVPDGTYTYYDLWPGLDNNGDGIADNVGAAGPKDKQSGPVAFYQNKSTMSDGTPITLDVLLKRDPSELEGYLPEGIIRLDTDAMTDLEIMMAIRNHMSENSQYTSCGNNCSDLATTGSAIAIG